jgi:hypothetical protein
MKVESGYSTLLLTSLIMLVVLVVSIATYRSTFQYFRLVEYRIRSLKSHWQAEGAVECLFAAAQRHRLLSLDVNACERDVDELTISGNSMKSIKSLSGFSSIEKTFILPVADSLGAVKSSSTLILTSGATFSPDPGIQDENDLWKCIAVRYKKQFIAPSVTTYHPYQMDLIPYVGFPQHSKQPQLCASAYHSLASNSSHTKSDYVHDLELEPFRDLFGVQSSQWFSIMSNDAVGRIPMSLDIDGKIRYSSADFLPEAHYVASCANDIVSRIRQGKDLIWVYGGCELIENDVTLINQAIEEKFADQGIILVVQNGVLAINSQQIFKGLVMQYTSPGSSLKAFGDWDKTSIYSHVSEYLTHFSTSSLFNSAQVSYFQVGRFNPLGGLLLSSDNTFAVIEGQLRFQYQRDLISQALSHIRPIHWVTGSWHDSIRNH